MEANNFISQITSQHNSTSPTPRIKDIKQMIISAIEEIDNPRGSSLVIIKKFIIEKYPNCDVENLKMLVTQCARKLLNDGLLISKTKNLRSSLKIRREKSSTNGIIKKQNEKKKTANKKLKIHIKKMKETAKKENAKMGANQITEMEEDQITEMEEDQI